MNDILVIKINILPESAEELKERTRKSWKINPKRLNSVNHVIVLHNLEVLEEYTLGSPVVYYIDGPLKGRVELELNTYDANKAFKGKTIDYKTSNPATIKSYNELKELISE